MAQASFGAPVREAMHDTTASNRSPANPSRDSDAGSVGSTTRTVAPSNRPPTSAGLDRARTKQTTSYPRRPSATAAALGRRGYDVVCFVRARSKPADVGGLLEGATVRVVDPTDPASLSRDGFAGERFDAVVSCMASRTGAPKDAWAIDHRAQLNVLNAARAAGVGHFVLLSAICVQKPRLAFQQAKLAFEAALVDSGLRYS